MNTNEKCCSSSGQGPEATSLFFTKAPGEDHYKAYARYNNCPSWVPIDTPQLSTPNLQQVRDADRNISASSGSYEDAHFYLRSAEGNNMTSAFFTNADGGAIQTGNATGFAPLNLQPDGGTLTYGGEEVATIPDQLMIKGTLGSADDLNTYKTTGVWTQSGNAGAAAGSNYPTALAGKLEVVTEGDFTYQTYHVYAEYNIMYHRSFWSVSGWSAWKKVATNADLSSGTGYLYSNGSSLTYDPNTMIKASVNFGADMSSTPQNSISYHYGGEPDNPSGQSGYSINGTVGGVSSVQLYVATGAAPGQNPDGFFWRGNNTGGPGWPGPWKQIASREWVNTAAIKNQNTSAQTANIWIDGNVRAAAVVDHTRGYAMISQSGYTGFFTDTSLNTAHPVKMGALTVSNSYADNAPTNGIFVKGKSYLTDNVGIGNTNPTEKLDVTGSIKQSAVTSSMLKADAGGKIVAATAGTDYMALTKGTHTIVGDGTTTSFSFAHGLGVTPGGVSMTPKSALANKIWFDCSGFVSGMNATNITVGFNLPPASGVSYEYWWAAFQ
jgi:hypothetical protein